MNELSLRRVDVECQVVVRVSDAAPDDWLSRVGQENFPYRNSLGGVPLTEEEGLEMLADNCVRNGVTDASRLDGWGDLERGMVTMEVDVWSVYAREAAADRG